MHTTDTNKSEPLVKNKSIYLKTDEEIDYKQVVSELKLQLEKYMQDNPYLSANSFCERNGLSSTTISYLLNGNTKKRMVAENIRKIVFGLNKGKSIKDVLMKTDGEAGKFLRKYYSGLLSINVEASPLDFERFHHQTKYGRIISLLAHNEGNTTRKEIVEALDSYAIETLDEMIKNKILIEKENGKIESVKYGMYLDLQATKSMIEDVAYYYKPTEKEKGLNYIRFYSGRLTAEKRRELNLLNENYDRSVRKVFQNQSKSGEHTFFSLMTDSLSKPKCEEEK